MKKALLIGINYKDSSNPLNGCANDVRNTYETLISNFDYKKENIVLLTDDSKTEENMPTFTNILNSLNAITTDKEADHYYIHYSGHGSRVFDTSGDESDKLDECIIPLDFEKKGVITDDMLINALKRIPPSKKAICVIDACNSGSMLDLRYNLNCLTEQISDEPKTTYEQQNWTYEYRLSEKKMYNTPSNIFLLSGCRDDQTSSDAYINSIYQGALTYFLLKVLKDSNYSIKLKYLLKDIHILLKKSNFSQKPVISCSRMFNLDQKFVM